MKLQMKTYCALWFLAYMACHKDVVPTRDLTSGIGFPKHCITSTATKLKEKGYIQTVVGPFGGYILAKSPNEITLQEILATFNDEFRLIGKKTPQTAGCALIGNLKKLLEKEERDFERILSGHTLADLM